MHNKPNVPQAGGSYRQEPKTGELTQIEGTKPAPNRADRVAAPPVEAGSTDKPVQE